MTDRRQYRLVSKSIRDAAKSAVDAAPEGYVVTIAEPTRTSEQNRKLWPLLTDVSKQVKWPNFKGELVNLKQETWKNMFTAALRKAHNEEVEMVPNLTGDGWVMAGEPTSTMSVRKFSELVELIYAFGSERSVSWSEPKE